MRSGLLTINLRAPISRVDVEQEEKGPGEAGEIRRRRTTGGAAGTVCDVAEVAAVATASHLAASNFAGRCCRGGFPGATDARIAAAAAFADRISNP